MLSHVDDYGLWVVAVITGGSALVMLGRKALKQLTAWVRRINEAFDTLLGRDEIRHPDTGAVLVPATPGLGRRLADMDATIARLADNDDRIGRLETQFHNHVEHSRELEELRAKEATEMWKAIQAVAQAEPPHDKTND